ncbi:MAG TPA: hypothetical protein VGD59_08675 [Acidisarcina sp.]
MADSLGISTGNSAGSAIDRQVDGLLRRYQSRSDLGKSAGVSAAASLTVTPPLRSAGSTPTGAASPAENNKIEKSARDFESILLGTWLQQAEQTFATVPGGDGEQDDADPGSEQLQGIATQALAGSLTASGGIGLARMISGQLRRAALDQQQGQQGRAEAAPAVGPANSVNAPVAVPVTVPAVIPAGNPGHAAAGRDAREPALGGAGGAPRAGAAGVPRLNRTGALADRGQVRGEV